MRPLELAGGRLREPKMRRRLVVMADQGLYSLSNVIAAVFVARSFDTPEPFGAFGLAMIVYQIVHGSTRALVGEPLLSLYSHREPSSRRRVIPELQTAALLIGALSSLALVAASTVLGGMSGSALLGLAVVLPFVLVQSTWRFAFIVDRPERALVIDLLWLVAVLVVFPLAPANADVAWYVVAWGFGGVLGASGGMLMARDALVARDVRNWPWPWRWITDHRDTSFRFFGEFLTARAVYDVVTSALGAIAGLGALGAVRASQVYYGPHSTLHAGIYLAVVPEGAQTRNDPPRLWRLLRNVSLALATLVILWMTVGMLLPKSWGEELFGGTWSESRELMLPMGVAMVASAIASGGLLGLRSLGDARRSLSTRMKIAPWQAVLPLAGALVSGALGFTIGFALARVVAAAAWWHSFREALHASVEATGIVGDHGKVPLPSPDRATSTNDGSADAVLRDGLVVDVRAPGEL